MSKLNDVLEEIKQAQMTRMQKRFANGDFEQGNGDDDDTRMCTKLSTTGCMHRFDVPREDVYLTARENRLRSFEMPNRATREERRIQNKVASLLKQGFKLRPTETLEEFIARAEEDV